MAGIQTITIVEQASYGVSFLICLYGLFFSYKNQKTVPGADLLFLGLLLYVGYTILALTLPGFGGSYFHSLTTIGKLGSETAMHFLSAFFKIGLIFIIIGILRIGRGSED